ncbi:MAG: HTTM domain-containing protein [Planctomycetota bacterium]
MRSSSRVTDFFFAEERPFGLALARICLPLVLLSVMLPRWYHARELFSADGAAAPLSLNYGMPDFLPVPSGTVAVAMASVLLFTLLTSAIGWCTRLSLVLSFGLYTYLNLLDCLGSLTKYSVIASHGLLLLAMSNCGAVWSFDALLRRRSGSDRLRMPYEHAADTRSAVWPRRIMQILIGMIYLGAAFTKMHTPAFFSSDQMRQWMLTNVNHANPIGEYLAFYPEVLVVAAYVTILWEVLFLFVAWKGYSRLCMISLGVFFHLGTTLLLGLYIFPLVCFSLYFSFLNERDVQRIGAWFRRLARRGNRAVIAVHSAFSGADRFLPRPSLPQARGVFAFAVLLLIFGGVELEYRLDPFGARRAEGAHQLKEIDAETVGHMLRASEPIREQDKYLTFEIGTDLLSDVVINRRSKFRHGESLVAQVVLTPPHEDMWIECNLHDADGHVIDEVGQIVERQKLRASWAYEMKSSLEPGRYWLVIRSSGQEIMRRSFELVASR